MTTVQTANNDALLDIELPDAEPEIYEFDGDIVAAEVQKPLPEWGDEAKDRIKLVVRDWNRTMEGMAERGLEKAYVFFPQGMSLSGGRTATLTKFSNNAKNKLGVTLRRTSDFIGLSARFQLAPARKGNGDVLSIVGKPKQAKPDGLAPYVPKVRETDDQVPDDNTPSAFEISAEGLVALREALGDTREAKEARKAISANRTFRAQFPAAYAAFISNPESVLGQL